MVVMSGDEGCWFLAMGIRVGVFVFKMIWFEFCSMSSMMVPLSEKFKTPTPLQLS